MKGEAEILPTKGGDGGSVYPPKLLSAKINPSLVMARSHELQVGEHHRKMCLKPQVCTNVCKCIHNDDGVSNIN